MSKGKKTGGRVRRNAQGIRLHHTPSQEALDAYNTWGDKAKTLDKAIISYNIKKEE